MCTCLLPFKQVAARREGLRSGRREQFKSELVLPSRCLSLSLSRWRTRALARSVRAN